MIARHSIRRRGFTITELLVSMALIMLIMAILSEAFNDGLRAFRSLKSIGDMQERMRLAQTRLKQDFAARHLEGDRKLSDIDLYWQDPNIGNGDQVSRNVGGRPSQGFFRIQTPPGTIAALSSTGAAFFPSVALEGYDSDQLPSFVADPSWLNTPLNRPVLHFAIKTVPDRKDALRRDLLYTTPVPSSSVPGNSLLDLMEGPPDFRQPGIINSPWAEVAWFIVPTGETAGSIPLYSLYRRQRLLIAPRRDSFLVTSPTAPPPGTPPGGGVPWAGLGQTSPTNSGYYGVAVEPDPSQNLLLWCNEYSVAEQPYATMGTTPGRAVGRSMMLQPQNPAGTPSVLTSLNQWISAPVPVGTQTNNGFPTGVAPEPAALLGDDLITTDVISFEIKVLRPGDVDFRDLNDPVFVVPNPSAGQAGQPPTLPAYTDPMTGTPGTYDTATSYIGWLSLRAIKVTLRVWDFKTNQARQITIVQDL